MLAIVAALMACTQADSPPPPAARVEQPSPPVVRMPVETDASRYVLREGPFAPETTIVTTFTAPADRAVYLMNCNGIWPMVLQRQVGNTWTDVWPVTMAVCLSPPVVIPAGQRRSAPLTVTSGADAVVSSRRTEIKIERGMYRVVWHGVRTSYDPNATPQYGEELPLEQRVSAPFHLEVAPPPDPSRTSPAQRPPEITSVEPAHASRVAADAPVRIRFALAANGIRLHGDRFNGAPHLYVDGQLVENVRRAGTDDEPQSMLELEYAPPRPWTPGRHEVRVVYQDQHRKMRWFGWSFTH